MIVAIWLICAPFWDSMAIEQVHLTYTGEPSSMVVEFASNQSVVETEFGDILYIYACVI